MKYFTAKMWDDLQREGKVGQQAFKLWDERYAAYHRQLKRLSGRVGSRTFRFFSQGLIHDCPLISFTVRDKRGEYYLAGRRRRGTTPPTSAEIELVSSYEHKRYFLIYSRVTRIEFSFSGKDELFFCEEDGLGDCGYDELSSAGKGRLRHEILFSSGSTLLLEFEKISVRTKRG